MPLQFDIGNNYCPIWLFFIYLTLCLICVKNYIFKLRNLMVLQKLDLLPRQILANNCVSLRLYLINGRFVLICCVSLRGKWFLLGLMFLNSRSFLVFFFGGGDTLSVLFWSALPRTDIIMLNLSVLRCAYDMLYLS